MEQKAVEQNAVKHKLQLIVGLGNPGPQYRLTRHNAGALFVEQLCQSYRVELRAESKFFGAFARANINDQDIRLLFPTTFMNNSGKSVAAVCRYFKIVPENVLVVYDEVDFEPGVIKLKQGGGHGGHNGIRDIIQALGGNKEFHRLRIGVGHPGNSKQVADYVLSVASKQQAESIQGAIEQALDIVPELAINNWQSAMKVLHSAN